MLINIVRPQAVDPQSQKASAQAAARREHVRSTSALIALCSRTTRAMLPLSSTSTSREPSLLINPKVSCLHVRIKLSCAPAVVQQQGIIDRLLY